MMEREEWMERERNGGREVKRNRWRDGGERKRGKDGGRGRQKGGTELWRKGGRKRERERIKCRILRCGCALDYSWTTQSDKAAHKVG